MRQIRSGEAGTESLARTTGSGVATPEEYNRSLIEPMQVLSRGGSLRSATRALWRSVRSDKNSELTERQARLIEERVVNDLEFARAFFERIPPTLVPRWKRMVDDTLKASTAAPRTAATSTLQRQ
jgi:hypothetical protein